MVASFAQFGTKPHRINEASLTGSRASCRMTNTVWVGAMLYRGYQSTSSAVSKYSWMSCLRRDKR